MEEPEPPVKKSKFSSFDEMTEQELFENDDNSNSWTKENEAETDGASSSANPPQQLPAPRISALIHSSKFSRGFSTDDLSSILPIGSMDDVTATTIASMSSNIAVDELLTSSGTPKSLKRTIHDRIHGHIEMEALLVAVMDTPQFQRLRSLKQLGGTIFVYPGASHTRFEHSVGVSYLAGNMVEHLHRQQPELKITERDYLCVKLAGLCHDLGHGPFSHMFELFINRVRYNEGKDHWEHEINSVLLLDHLLETNNINVADYGLLSPKEDISFVKHLIHGLKPNDPWPTDIGRSENKRFLFDIVANKRNGIDVDKLDYFERDSVASLGRPPIACDINRIVRSTRVCEVDGQLQVCFQEKMALGIFDIFKLRAWLHKYVYQHHTVNLIEEMICDALFAANDHFLFVKGKDGKPVRLSDAVDDVVAFSRIGDWILEAIEASCDENLKEAQEIIQRIRARHLYCTIYMPTHLNDADWKLKERDIFDGILSHMHFKDKDHREKLMKDLLVHFVRINYGSKDPQTGMADNPVKHVRFFNPKANANYAYSLGDKKMPDLFTPRAFSETLVYVYSRSDDSLDDLEDAYKIWRSQIARQKVTASATLTPLVLGNPQSPRKGRMMSRTGSMSAHANASVK